MTATNTATPPTPKPASPILKDRVPPIVGLILAASMIIPILWMLVKGSAPWPTSLDKFKGFVNVLSQPQISLPFFFMPLLILMIVYYRRWTKPIIFWPMFLGFCVVYFGSMAIDKNYAAILEKADNVPITMMLIGAILCLWVAFRQSAINDSRLEAGLPMIGQDREDKTLVWPDLVYTELLCLVLATAVLVVWSILLRAPLESPANPLGPPNPSKAPWYFLGLQEMLVYFDPWMAGVLLPGLIITGLISMPFIDTNPKGNGYYTISQRRFAIGVWLFGFLILWVVLIIFGTFLRGPNWNFFGPYEYWDAHRQVPLTNVNLSEYFWGGKKLMGFGLDEPLPTNAFMRESPGIILTILWIVGIPPLLARTVFRRLYLQMGFWRYYIMVYHFMFMAMLPLKMVLRWLFVLKYFIYLPEFNLNL